MRALAALGAVVVLLTPWSASGTPKGGEKPSSDDLWVTSGDPVEHLGANPEGYGTEDPIYTWVSADEFRSTSDDGFHHVEDGFWTDAPGMVVVQQRAPLHLPAGALIVGYSVVYEDSHAVANLSVHLETNYVFSSTQGTTQIGPAFQSSGAPGVTTSYVDVAPDHTVWHAFGLQKQSYAFEVGLAGVVEVKFRGVFVHWYRQVSPAPASATFSDVPTNHWAFRHIEALADSGITAGCGATTFCPDAPLTRAQMAVFLAKALGLHYQP